jgi:cellulose synthase/poly-beta-1,6-N-acetylglucosamine synthase-like glycosyltransferase
MFALIFSILLQVYLFYVVFFFVAMNVVYTMLMILSYRKIMFYMRQNLFSDYGLMVKSELTPPVTLLAPAYNEEKTVVESVKSLLKLNYGKYEVLVINDGSKDGTLDVLIQEFDLYRSKQIYIPIISAKPVRGIYKSKKAVYKNLIIVDKVNGGKADALNVGINVSRYEYVCAMDADSLLEEDALQKVMKPFLEDSSVIASGGIIRIANGCEIVNGRVVKVGLSHRLLPLFQVIEYFRAFLSGRMGWQGVNGLLIISGAFGMFKKSAVIEVGGYRSDTVGEDMELVARMHRIKLEKKEPYKIVFVPDPVCWTEVPESLQVLSRQRNRWHRGLLDVIIIHRKMLLNKNYGVIGLAAMPYFFFIELLAPLIEFTGYITAALMLIFGTLHIYLVGLFFIVSLFYGVMFSVCSVLLEEISFRRYPNPKHLALLLAMGVIENFGYRQLTAWWRTKAFYDYARGKKEWGAMQRKGFNKKIDK